MRFPTNLLSIFAKHNGTQEVSDGVLDVPRVLLPVLEIPEVINSITQDVAATAVQRGSFESSFLQINTNVVGGNFTVAKVGPGIWDWFITVTFWSNYTLTTGLAAIAVTDPDTGSNVIIALFVPYTKSETFTTRIRNSISPQTSRDIYLTLATNGVGQTQGINCHITGNRLG